MERSESGIATETIPTLHGADSQMVLRRTTLKGQDGGPSPTAPRDVWFCLQCGLPNWLASEGQSLDKGLIPYEVLSRRVWRSDIILRVVRCCADVRCRAGDRRRDFYDPRRIGKIERICRRAYYRSYRRCVRGGVRSEKQTLQTAEKAAILAGRKTARREVAKASRAIRKGRRPEFMSRTPTPGSST